MEKRVTFRGWLLPLVLIAPQVDHLGVFFFYPAGQAIWQSLFIPDPFGLSIAFVGLGNFEFSFGDKYLSRVFYRPRPCSLSGHALFDDPGAVSGRAGGSVDKGLGRVPHPAHLALCGCPGRCRCSVACSCSTPASALSLVSGAFGL